MMDCGDNKAVDALYGPFSCQYISSIYSLTMSSNSRRGHRDRQSGRGTNNSSSDSVAPPAGPHREQVFSASQQPRPPARLDEVVNSEDYPSASRGAAQGSNAGGSNPNLPYPGTSSRPTTRPPSVAPSLLGPGAPNVSGTSFPTPSTLSMNSAYAWSAGIRPPTRRGTPQQSQEALRAYRQAEQENDSDGLNEYTPLQRYNVQGADNRLHVSLAEYNRSASNSGTSVVRSETGSGPPRYSHSRPPSYAGSRDHVPQQMPYLPRESPPQYAVPAPQVRLEEMEEPIEELQQRQPRSIWSCCGGQSSSDKRSFGRKKKSTARRCGTINFPEEHGSVCRECGHRLCHGCGWGSMSAESGDPPDGGRPRGSEDDRDGPGGGGGSSRAKGKGKAFSKGGLFERLSPSKHRART
ncbi:hypothetical protein EJ03DRAFT_153181 [Teratosphaeria nubilosa]|uniref:Uncharacterized protein n=1 Tax=Teratosphaeria nubilosa TaxID=161662 RepID=A0A6G1LJG3_9PEZI|nr:hypothetical protein EJ03DRAFT_153181 [Teratosphaeria nubilosa]